VKEIEEQDHKKRWQGLPSFIPYNTYKVKEAEQINLLADMDKQIVAAEQRRQQLRGLNSSDTQLADADKNIEELQTRKERLNNVLYVVAYTLFIC